MKYQIIENSDHTHTLLRYGEKALPNEGAPSNAELEFWYEIERLREALAKIERIQLTKDSAFTSGVHMGNIARSALKETE